jgi:hypothetical protein
MIQPTTRPVIHTSTASVVLRQPPLPLVAREPAGQAAGRQRLVADETAPYEDTAGLHAPQWAAGWHADVGVSAPAKSAADDVFFFAALLDRLSPTDAKPGHAVEVRFSAPASAIATAELALQPDGTMSLLLKMATAIPRSSADLQQLRDRLIARGIRVDRLTSEPAPG